MTDAGLVVIAAAVMKDAIGKADRAARDRLNSAWRPGHREPVWIDTPNGEVEVGTITKTKPTAAKAVRRVTDPAAFLAWVKATRPDEVVTTEHVRESFQQVLLNKPEVDENGEVIDNPPGVEWVEVSGKSTIQVRPTDGAHLAIAAAVAAGTVSLDDVLALPGGSDD